MGKLIKKFIKEPFKSGALYAGGGTVLTIFGERVIEYSFTVADETLKFGIGLVGALSTTGGPVLVYKGAKKAEVAINNFIDEKVKESEENAHAKVLDGLGTDYVGKYKEEQFKRLKEAIEHGAKKSDIDKYFKSYSRLYGIDQTEVKGTVRFDYKKMPKPERKTARTAICYYISQDSQLRKEYESVIKELGIELPASVSKKRLKKLASKMLPKITPCSIRKYLLEDHPENFPQIMAMAVFIGELKSFYKSKAE